MSGRLLLSVALSTTLAGAALADEPSPMQEPGPQVTCDFIEIGATKGKPSIDPALRPVEKKLKKAPFSTQWTEFKQLSQTQKRLVKKKTEAIPLKQGSATATLVETVDASKVRLTVTIDNAKGKKAVDNTSVVDAADYVIYTIVLPNEDGHLVAVTCK
ncbi:MAG: hypothetical protein ACTHU0_39145 [Kofleriaceae bacterium]